MVGTLVGMIDFTNRSVFKLTEADPEAMARSVEPVLVMGENVVACFKAVRDSSLPYNKIQAWSVETAGSFDLDAELDLWFSGLGQVRLEFKGRSDVRGLSQMIATYVL